ncbi:MAG: Maf family nucleotide pyrophosphatase [Candidatus Omnitrophota bacterium]
MKPPLFVLASASQARKKILDDIGLKVKVLASRVIESRKIINGPAALVKHNALNKLKEVSKRIDNCIIISADTISVFNSKVFGKAGNFSQGVAMLKKLSGSEHYVYTGLAVMDKRTKDARYLLDYEKTKVKLKRLTDEEIKNYLKKADSFNKAGSFDIQGRGGLLIERIEGCFYNVVGLPLSKLFDILKKLNISILSLFFISLLALSGCATEYNIATQQEDIIFYDTEKEINIGRNASGQIERKFKLVEDPILLSRINKIGESLVAVCDRKDLTYRFAVLNDDAINAVSLPGGFIYVNLGLIDFARDDDELASVLAHEIAHVVAKHSIKRLQAAMGFTFLQILAVATGNTDAVRGSDIAAISMLSAYSREDELLADKLGARYMREAGFDPTAFISFLDRLNEKKFSEPLRPAGFYARTHPYISERIGMVKEETGQELNFKDYINRPQ